MSPRLHTLHQRHRQLEDRIDDELTRPLPDHLLLQRLKRRKLRLKDKMTLMSPQPA